MDPMTITGTDDRNDRSGFTLLELIVIMAFIGLLAGIAAPRIDVAKFRMDSAAVEVSTALHAAQQTALLRGHNVNIAFDTAAGALIVHYDEDNDKTIDSSENWRTVEFGEGVAFGRGGAPALNGVNPSISFTVNINSKPGMRFYRNGSTSEAGTIYLTSRQGKVGTTYAEHSRAMEIERSTGRIRCYSYKSGAWEEKC